MQNSKVFFDIVADNEPMGRIEVMLFDDVVPKTVKNFKALAKGIGLNTAFASKSLCENNNFNLTFQHFENTKCIYRLMWIWIPGLQIP